MMSSNSSPHPQPEFLADLIQQAESWARQAGQIALRDFKKVRPISSKADETLLTTTDIEIEQYLTHQIRTTFPNHNLLAEEGAQRHTSSLYTWIVDPLDGTTAFVHGLPGWGISLALLYQGHPIFGLYYMPLLDDLTYATSQTAICNNEPLQRTVRTDWNDNGFLAVNTSAHHDFEINIPRIRALGSISANLVYTARGSATAAFIPKAYLWDLAAGVLILTRAGGELRYLSGRIVDLAELLDGRLVTEPIVAGHPVVLEGLGEKIKGRSDGPG
ncbi:MAG: inositol monophosphatase [Anaerolineales bacterium]|nr:inositol monophosphatase [Anaerolineales bacterium]